MGPDLKVDSVKLTDLERDFLITFAKEKLLQNPEPAGGDSYPSLYRKNRSALFVSLTYPEKTAKIEFSNGDSIIGALRRATDLLVNRVAREEREKAIVRIDLVNKTFKMISISKKGRLSFKPSIHGLYIRSKTPIALHPMEIVSRGVVQEQGSSKKRGWKYLSGGMKNALKMRGISSIEATRISKLKPIKAKPFTVDSFIEDITGKSLALYRWSPKEIKITPELLLKRCEMAGKYLVSIVDDKGRFDYLYYPEKSESSNSYNLLRHCGTIYSMVQLFEVVKDPDLLAAIQRAIGFVLENNLTDPREKDAHLGWKCIRGEGYKDKAKDRRRAYCKLGGGGLFLVALSKYTMATGDKQYLPVMKKLAEFIKYMQADDGDMRSKYHFNDLPHKPFKSLFYPGEAAYGLGLLYQIDNNKKWITTGHKAVAWLANSRKGVKPIRLPIDHWLIIAMNELYKGQENDSNKDHVFDICKGIIQKQRIAPKQLRQPDLFGGWGSRPQTSSNATQVEGLVAAYHLASQSGDDPEVFYAAAWNAANMLLRMQYTQYSVSYFEKPEKIIGGFVSKIDVPEIQIDNVQHSLSALLGIYHIYNARQGRPPDTDLYNSWRAQAR